MSWREELHPRDPHSGEFVGMRLPDGSIDAEILP